MEIHPIAKTIVEKGIDNVDLSMFKEDERKIIYLEAADIFLRLNKISEYLIAMEKGGRLCVDELIKKADNMIEMGEYKKAYLLLIKTNQIEIANFIKSNFLHDED